MRKLSSEKNCLNPFVSNNAFLAKAAGAIDRTTSFNRYGCCHRMELGLSHSAGFVLDSAVQGWLPKDLPGSTDRGYLSWRCDFFSCQDQLAARDAQTRADRRACLFFP